MHMHVHTTFDAGARGPLVVTSTNYLLSVKIKVIHSSYFIKYSLIFDRDIIPLFFTFHY
jgi:hypothetical protein